MMVEVYYSDENEVQEKVDDKVILRKLALFGVTFNLGSHYKVLWKY